MLYEFTNRTNLQKKCHTGKFFRPFLSGFPSIALPIENSVEGV